MATAIRAEGARAEPRIAAWVPIGSGIASFAAGIPSRASITGASYTVRC